MKTFTITLGVLVALWLLTAIGLLPAIVSYAIVGVILIGGVYFVLRFMSLTTRQKKRVKQQLKSNWWIFPVAAAPAILFTALGWIPNAGARGTPVIYYGFWWFLGFVGMIFVGRCIFSNAYKTRLTCAIKDWARRGGCWKIYAEDNLPANSAAIVWLVLVLVAILYGPPTPKVDLQELAYRGKYALHQASESGIGQGATGLIDTFAEGLLGKPVFTSDPSVGPPEPPAPRYHKGWRWILFCFFLFPIVVSGLIWSRRDEVAEKLKGLASIVKKRREDTRIGEATSRDEEVEGGEGEGEGRPSRQEGGTPFSRLLASDALAFALVSILDLIVGFMRKH